VRDIEQLEHKTRRQDVLVDEELIFAFYDAQIPAEVVDVAASSAGARTRKRPSRSGCSSPASSSCATTPRASPRTLPAADGDPRPALSPAYHFEPGTEDDGVTLTVPVAALNQVPAVRCEWLVPGLLEQKAAQFVKTLPQKYRHRLQPVDEFVADFAEEAHDRDEPLVRALTRTAEERLP
jgi:ATP-dependent helicase HrpA